MSEEGIDCDYHKGGAVHFATNAAQRASLREGAEIASARLLGWKGAA